MRMSGRLVGPVLGAALAASMLATSPVLAQAPAPAKDDGVKVGRPSILRKLVSAEKLEQAAEQNYAALTRKAFQEKALLPDTHPTMIRLRRIFNDILPHSYKFNDRAKDWKWEVNGIQSGNINAFCMPGGKIAFFTGIIEKLKLTDDEVAIVMGHEIAHALREHARARAVKGTLANIGGAVAGMVIGGGLGQLAQQGAGLLTLKFSRGDETDADLVGLEIAARAGYNPAAGVVLWQKMGKASQGAPPAWLSTHPSGPQRIDTIKAHLKEATPIYEAALKAKKPQ
jgi:predicted Zn-dependent protease